jgi:hypothetical protein
MWGMTLVVLNKTGTWETANDWYKYLVLTTGGYRCCVDDGEVVTSLYSGSGLPTFTPVEWEAVSRLVRR